MASETPKFWLNKPFGDRRDPAPAIRVRKAIPIKQHPRPLREGERGLVFGYPVSADEGDPGRVHVTGEIDRHDLRFNLLFWDRLNIASPVDFDLTPEEQVLVREGVIDCTRFVDVATVPDLHESSMLDAPLHAFEPLMEREPGRWALGRADYALSPSCGFADTLPGTLFTLTKLVPVPKLVVPVEDILVFKQKRKAELAAFRTELQDIALRIQAAGDLRPTVSAHEVEKLKKALRDLHLVVGESRMQTGLGSLGQYLNFDIGGAVVGAATAAAAAAAGVAVWFRSRLGRLAVELL